MIDKLAFFLHLYDKRKEIFSFVFTTSRSIYNINNLTIKNNNFFYFKIVNNKIWYIIEKKEYCL